MSFLEAVDRWLFPPASARRLAGARIALCLFLAFRLSRPMYMELAGQPPALFRPRSFMTLLDGMPGRSLVLAVQVLGVVTALLGAAGWWTRVTMPAAWLSALFLNGMHNSIGKIMHNDVLLLLVLLPFVFAPVSDAWKLFGKKAPGEAASRLYGWPLRAASMVVVIAYFFAGYWKLRFSGIEWVTSDNMKWILLASAAGQHSPNPMALFIAAHGPLYHSIAAMSLGLELTFPAVLAWPKAVVLYVPGAILMHLGITLAMGLDYSAWMATLVAVFLDWDAVAQRLERRRAARLGSKDPAMLLYDDDCGFCRWSMAKVAKADRYGLLIPRTIQDPRSDALLVDMTESEKLGSWHVVVGRQVYSGGAGAAPLLERLPFGRPLAWVPRRLPGLTERIYRFIASRRDRFGEMLGAEVCSVDPSTQNLRDAKGKPSARA